MQSIKASQPLVNTIKPSSPQSPQFANVNTSRIQKRRPVPKRESSFASSKSSATINALSSELIQREAEITAMCSRIHDLENELRRESLIVKRSHPLVPVQHIIQENGRRTTTVGRSGSIATIKALESVSAPSKSPFDHIAERFLSICQSPVDHINYLQSKEYAFDLIKLCKAVMVLFECEPRCIFLQSPVYVFGDIHGNLEDLLFFADNVWKLGMDLTAGKFLFLGDYVDRGENGIECISYLFAMKLLYRNKIHLLRGNHETRDVNGWEDYYKEKCFLFQCKVIQLGDKKYRDEVYNLMTYAFFSSCLCLDPI